MTKKLFAIAGILPALLLVIGCASVGSGPAPPGELTVLNHTMTRGESGNVAVQVTVKNTGPVMAELAEVTVSFYDADKNLIDSSSDSVINLRPGETWDFEFVLTETDCQDCGDVTRYDIQTFAGVSSGGI